MLMINELCVEFPQRGSSHGVPAVDGASLNLENRKTLAVVGESGSGKSVMGMAVCGLLPRGARTSGRIIMDGRSLLDMRPDQLRGLRKHRISFVPQSAGLSLNPTMACGMQVSEVFTHCRNYSLRSGAQATCNLLGRLGFSSRRTRDFPHCLSGGMRQRVLVGIGLAGASDLLIADEPTKGLDADRRDDVGALFKKVREVNPAMGVLLITHDMHLARALADEVAVMYGGRIVEQSPARLFFDSPHHPYSRALLNALPERGLKPIPGTSPHPFRRPTGCIFHPRCAVAQERCYNQAPPQNGNGKGWIRCWRHAQA